MCWKTPSVGSCVECNENYCSFHIENHQKSRKTINHKIIQKNDKIGNYCSEHKSELSLVCVDKGCGKILCLQCCKGGSHNVIHLSDHSTQVKGKLKDYLEISKKRLMIYQT